jgi:protein-arginine kinase activator protein McsA
VKINQLKEELDESVRSQDFAKAADIKEAIKSLDEERDQLFKDNVPQVREVRSEEKVIT